MSCSYYIFKDNDYHCLKNNKDVSSDWYYKYCRNYDYDDCPVYKGESSSGGCYLTTACVRAKNLPDDCMQLCVLREFRDNWLRVQHNGLAVIEEYYQIAPVIVGKIESMTDSKRVWDELFESMVQPCVDFIKNGEYNKAYALYLESTNRLVETYC